MQLRGKVAVVVGATGLLGRAIVSRLVREGCRVAATARNDMSLQELKDALPAANGCISIHPADVTSEDEVHCLFGDVRSQKGRVDVFIYTAGIKPDPETPLKEYPLSSWNETLNTYLTGYFLCLREALTMVEAEGHIVAISSAVTRFSSDTLPPFHAGHYAAAKAAVNELSKWARRDAHGRNVLLSCIAPGALDMPFHRDAPPERRPQAVLPPAQIADVIVDALINKRELDQFIVPDALVQNYAPSVQDFQLLHTSRRARSPSR